MKRVLISLSLTFLSTSCGLSDNSNIYLICSAAQQREYIFQGRKTDAQWKNMDKTQIENNKNSLAFTLNERDESGTVSFPKTGVTQKLDIVSFNSKSIFTGIPDSIPVSLSIVIPSGRLGAQTSTNSFPVIVGVMEKVVPFSKTRFTVP